MIRSPSPCSPGSGSSPGPSPPTSSTRCSPGRASASRGDFVRSAPPGPPVRGRPDGSRARARRHAGDDDRASPLADGRRSRDHTVGPGRRTTPRHPPHRARSPPHRTSLPTAKRSRGRPAGTARPDRPQGSRPRCPRASWLSLLRTHDSDDRAARARPGPSWIRLFRPSWSCSAGTGLARVRLSDPVRSVVLVSSDEQTWGGVPGSEPDAAVPAAHVVSDESLPVHDLLAGVGGDEGGDRGGAGRGRGARGRCRTARRGMWWRRSPGRWPPRRRPGWRWSRSSTSAPRRSREPARGRSRRRS